MAPADAPLTKTDFLEAIKDLPTKDDVREIVQDELAQYTNGHTDPQYEVLKKGQAELRRGQEKIKADIQIIKDDVRDLKADTVAQKDFEKLREKVELHHPTN